MYVGAVGSSDGLSKTHFFLQHCSIVSALQSPLPSGGDVDFPDHFLLISLSTIFFAFCILKNQNLVSGFTLGVSWAVAISLAGDVSVTYLAQITLPASEIQKIKKRFHVMYIFL